MIGGEIGQLGGKRWFLLGSEGRDWGWWRGGWSSGHYLAEENPVDFVDMVLGFVEG